MQGKCYQILRVMQRKWKWSRDEHQMWLKFSGKEHRELDDPHSKAMVVIIRGFPLQEVDRSRESRSSFHRKRFYPDVRKAVLIIGRSPPGPWYSMLRPSALAGWLVCAAWAEKAHMGFAFTRFRSLHGLFLFRYQERVLSARIKYFHIHLFIYWNSKHIIVPYNNTQWHYIQCRKTEKVSNEQLQ